MNTEIIIATLSAFTTVMALILTNYWTKRNQMKFDERRLKEDYYTQFIKTISDSVISEHTDRTRDNFADIQNKLLLIGSSDVVNNLMNFHNYIKGDNPEFLAEKHDELLTKLIKSMRYDLFGNTKVNDKYPTIHLTGKSK